MHELLGQELPHAGAQHGAAIGAAAVGGGATPFELHLPALAFKDALDDRHGPAIAVAIPGAKGALLDVLAAVDREGITGGPAVGAHGRCRCSDVTGEEALELLVVGELITKPEFCKQGVAVGDVFRLRNGRWGHWHPVA